MIIRLRVIVLITLNFPTVNLICSKRVSDDRQSVVISCTSDRELIEVKCSVNSSPHFSCTIIPKSIALQNHDGLWLAIALCCVVHLEISACSAIYHADSAYIDSPAANHTRQLFFPEKSVDWMLLCS